MRHAPPGTDDVPWPALVIIKGGEGSVIHPSLA